MGGTLTFFLRIIMMFLIMLMLCPSTSNNVPITFTAQENSNSPELSNEFHSAKSSLLELINKDQLGELDPTQLRKIINITEELIVHANTTLQSLLSEINTTKHSWKAAKANHSKMKTEREEAETILYDSEVYKNKTAAEEAERNANSSYVSAKNNYTEWKKLGMKANTKMIWNSLRK